MGRRRFGWSSATGSVKSRVADHERARVVALTLAVFVSAAGSALAVANGGAQVPLHPVPALRSVLATNDYAYAPKITSARRSVDGSVLAAWDYSAISNRPGFVQAQRFAANGQPAGSPFRVDPVPPAVSGYHYTGDSAPSVAYSSSADGWIVLITASYASNRSCTRHLRNRVFVGPCSTLSPVLSIRLDGSGQITGPPTTVLESSLRPPYFGPFVLACRVGGCIVVGQECTDPGVYECDFGRKEHQLAIPLDEQGAPVSARPIEIDLGHHGGCPNDLRHVVFPPDGQEALSATSRGYLATWSTGLVGGGSTDCILVRSIAASGVANGPIAVANQRPQGNYNLVQPGARWAFSFTDPQVCTYAEGTRALVTWFVGANGESGIEFVPGALPKVGIYRQTYDNAGRLVGRDRRAILSVSGYAGGTYSHHPGPSYPFDGLSLFAGPNQDRCIVLAVGVNKVDAFAYDSDGRIRQDVELFAYHHNLNGPPADDVVSGTWLASDGLLFDMRNRSRVGPESLTAYPLR
jgi:hypothetical protein